MLTVQTVQNIKRGSRITLINGIYAIILGILYSSLYRFIIKTNFHSIDAIWQVFSKYNPDISALFIKLLIIKGLFIISIGIMIIYLSSYIIKKKDKSAWFVLFLIGLIFWGSLLTVEILDKNVYTIVLSGIGWLMFIIGMLLPIKYYLERDYEDY
jgi:hypothetical protein